MKLLGLLCLLCIGFAVQAQQGSCECVIQVHDELGNTILTVGPGMVSLSLTTKKEQYNVNELCLTGASLDSIKQFILPGNELQPTKLLTLSCCNMKRVAYIAGASTQVGIPNNNSIPTVGFDAHRRISLLNDCIEVRNLRFEQ